MPVMRRPRENERMASVAVGNHRPHYKVPANMTQAQAEAAVRQQVARDFPDLSDAEITIFFSPSFTAEAPQA